MPQLPQYQRQQQARPGFLQARAPINTVQNNAVANTANTLQQAGNQVLRQNELVQRKEQQDATAWAVQEAAERHNQDRLVLEEAKRNAPAGAPDFYKNFSEQLTVARSKRAQGIAENPVAKRYANHPAAEQYLNLTTTKHNGTLLADATAFETKKAVQNRTNQLETAANEYANLAYANPESVSDLKLQLQAGIENAGFDATDANEMVVKLGYKIGGAAVEGLISRNPQQALSDLQKGTYKNLIDPERLGVLSNRARSELRKQQKVNLAGARRIKSQLNQGVLVPKEDILYARDQALAEGDDFLAEDLSKEANVNYYSEAVTKLSLQDQRDELAALYATPGYKSKPQTLEQINKLESIIQDSEQAAGDPYETARKRGIYQDYPAVFDEQGLISPQGLMERAPVADDLAGRYNGEMRFLSGVETTDYLRKWETLNSDEQQQQLAIINQQLPRPEDRTALINQLFGKKAGSTLAIATAVVGDDAGLARSVIRGAQAIKSKTVEMPSDKELLAAYRGQYGDIIQNPEHVRQLVDTVKYKAAERAMDENLNNDDVLAILEDEMESIVGHKVKTGGGRIGLFNKAQETISFKLPNGEHASGGQINEIFKRLGRKQNTDNPAIPLGFEQPYAGGEVANFKDIIDVGTLQPIGKGLYHVFVGDGVVTKEDNETPYVFDMPKLYQMVADKK